MHDFDKNSGEKCPFMAEADALDAQQKAAAAAPAADAAANTEMSAEEEIASLHAQLEQAKTQAKEESELVRFGFALVCLNTALVALAAGVLSVWIGSDSR